MPSRFSSRYRHRNGRRLIVDRLEDRRLLALVADEPGYAGTAIDAMAGLVFEDFGSTGYGADDIAFDPITLISYRDDGDGRFDPGKDAYDNDLSLIVGEYRFPTPSQDGLYFLVRGSDDLSGATPTVGASGYAVRVSDGTLTVVGGQIQGTRLDFGFRRSDSMVRGLVWHDFDQNGQPDAGEARLAGWRIYADADRDGQFDPFTEYATTTDAEGRYFLRIPAQQANDFSIAAEPQPGWQITSPGLAFTAPKRLKSSQQGITSRTTSAVTEDVDGDGDLDLIVTSEDLEAASGSVVGRLRIWTNDGGAEFRETRVVTLDHRPRVLLASELTPGAGPSLLMSDVGLTGGAGGAGSLSIVSLRDGLEESVQVLATTLNGPIAAAAGDLNEDGFLDLVVVGFRRNEATVFWNDQGRFGRATSLAVGNQPIDVTITDIDQDGSLDIVTIGFRDATDRVLSTAWLGDGRGSFARDRGDTASDQEGLDAGDASILATDLNRDGIVDLAIAQYLHDRVSVRFGNAARGFDEAFSLQFPRGFRPVSLAVSDLDGNSYPELLVTGQEANSVIVMDPLRNAATTVRTTVATGRSPEQVVAADFDGDDRIDLAVASQLDGMAIHLATGLACEVTLAGAGDSTTCTFGVMEVDELNDVGGLVFLDQNRNAVRDGYRLNDSEFVVVIDRSVSAAKNQGELTWFELMKQATIAFSQRLRELYPLNTPRITVVTFDDDVSIGPGMFRQPASETLETAISRLETPPDESGRGTNFVGAVQFLNNLMHCNTFGESLHVLMLSDGDLPVAAELPPLAESSATLRSRVSTIQTFAPLEQIQWPHPPPLNVIEGSPDAQRRALVSISQWLTIVAPDTGLIREPGIAGVEVVVDQRRTLLTRDDDPETPQLDERGSFMIDRVPDGQYTFTVLPPDGVTVVDPRRSVLIDGPATFPLEPFAVQPPAATDAAPSLTCPGVARGAATLDVNRDGFVSPFDALLIVNRLNASRSDGDSGTLDVNGDGLVTPLDALLVINFLNAT